MKRKTAVKQNADQKNISLSFPTTSDKQFPEFGSTQKARMDAAPVPGAVAKLTELTGLRLFLDRAE